MERMMKVQEVILKAMAGSLKWWEAAEIIGVSDRTMKRWRELPRERLRWTHSGEQIIGYTPSMHRQGFLRLVGGGSAALVIDANNGCTAPAAIRFGRLVEKFNPFWFEE